MLDPRVDVGFFACVKRASAGEAMSETILLN
jgi:hypothetical protein